MEKKFRTLKLACYTTSLSMSIVANLPPVLFLIFRPAYGISYSQMGLLIVINYMTQLLIDLIFSFFSHKFSIDKTIRSTPLICAAGLIFYGLSPFLFPGNEYIGLLIGTVIFSAGAGLAEVLISPVIAAIPSKDPDRQMSGLHSVYAWGVVAVILLSTFYLQFISGNWTYLALLLSIVPITSGLLFTRTEIPVLKTPEKADATICYLKDKVFWLSVLAIFVGGASECNMAQWASGYLEQAMGIPKAWGDIFGVAMFSVLLGIGRTIYAKRGKNIGKILLLSSIGATACYLVAAITPIPLFGLIACALTGLCTSLMWPGNLVVATDHFPAGGVFLYAMMAAGGDLGASIAPQLVGIITDTAIASTYLSNLAVSLNLTPEQFGMRLGILVGSIFPMISIILFVRILKIRKEKGLET